MITVLKNGENYKVFAGKSTDSKPSSCGNGSQFIEVDTGYEYVYDAEGDAWTKMGSGGTPVVHSFFLKVSIPNNFEGYETGDYFDPTDFEVSIVNEADETVDTIKASVLASMSYSNNTENPIFILNGTGVSVWAGIINGDDEYVQISPIDKAQSGSIEFVMSAGGGDVEVPAEWLDNGTEGITLSGSGKWYDASITITQGVDVYHLAVIGGTGKSTGGSLDLGDFELRILDADGVMVNAVDATIFENGEYAEDGYCYQYYDSASTATFRLYLRDDQWHALALQSLVAGEYTAQVLVFTAGQTAYPVTLDQSILAEQTGDITLLTSNLASATVTVTVSGT